MNKKILFCPLCNEMLKISELKCSKCNITLRGDFSGCEFCSLTPENREFLKIYLRCEGNIKKIERILGISYPTVKSKIDSLLSALNLNPVEVEADGDIFDAIGQGKISVDEAVQILKERKRKSQEVL